MALHGLDVSRHQGDVDFVAYRNAGYDFCIIKGTDGTSYNYISWFRAHFPKLKASGMVPGVYHFLNKENGYQQAQYFVDEVNKLGGFKGVLAVVDVEVDADGTKPSISTVRAFAQEFKRLVPNHPLIVYTGRWFWVGHLGNPHGADIGPLWHSEYETSQAEINDGPEADNYGGWSGATIWQYTSTPIDKNLFFGTRTQLLALAAGGAAQEDALMAVTEAEFDALARKVHEIAVSVVPFHQDAYPSDARFQVQTLVRRAAPTAAQIAAAVAAVLPETLPDGSVTHDVVEEAVKQALREGVGV